MNDFVVTYDASFLNTIFITLGSISFIAIVIAIIKQEWLFLIVPFICLVIGLLSSANVYLVKARQEMKKEAINRIDPIWKEKVQKEEIAAVPVRSIDIDGNYLKIRLANDEIYYTPFEEISPLERKVTPDFIKSTKLYEEPKRSNAVIVPVIVP